jgi:hypothetical protein
MKKLLISLSISIAIFGNSYALDSCGNFYIQISNQTSSTCKCTNNTLINGIRDSISSVPLSILPKDFKEFNIIQGRYYGPDLILSYQCGSETISFRSQQNLCIMKAGHITGAILNPRPASLTASYKTFEGSWLHDLAGRIIWTIK